MNGNLNKFFKEINERAKYIGIDNFNYSVNISLKHKYIYVETPKVACSTIKSTLQKIELDDASLSWIDYKDIHNREYSPLLKPSQVGDFYKLVKDRGYIKFCFVRNPYTRLLSVYLEKIVGNKEQKRNILSFLGYDYQDLSRNITFEEFIKGACSQKIESMDPHWRVQYYQTLQDSVHYDIIGKIENFDKDFKHVLKKIGIDNYDKYFSVEKRHASNAGNKISDYYTEELRDIVYTKFKKDFEHFNYSSILSCVSQEQAREVNLHDIKKDIESRLTKANVLEPGRINESGKKSKRYCRDEIHSIENELMFVKSSKFWRLRNFYILLKNRIGFALFHPKKFIQIKRKKVLVMTLLVRDEVDIIEENIKFHLNNGVDFIIATDNGSVDGTREILKKYQDRGVLHLIDEPNQNYFQAIWVNRMGKIAREKYHADYVFHCDADEFWYSKSGNLKKEMASKKEPVLKVNVFNVLPCDMDGKEKFPDDIKYAIINPIESSDLQKDSEENNLYLYKYPPKVIFESKFDVIQGNHDVIGADSYNKMVSDDIVIYHYPIRGREHFFRKTINGGASYNKNKELGKEVGFHWRRWYEAYKNGRLDFEYKKLILSKEQVSDFLSKKMIKSISFKNLIHNKI